MADHWQALIANLAVVALFISSWVHGHFVLASWARWQRNLVFGIAMGIGAVASMQLAIPINGALFDLRLSLIGIAGFFGGPVAGLTAVAIAAGFRLFAVGGPLGLAGAASIAGMAVAAMALSRVTRKRVPAIVSACLLALLVVSVSVASRAATGLTTSAAAIELALPVAVMNGLSAVLSAFFIMRYRVIERERDLLRQAFLSSPDYQYVKTPESRFAAVNRKVAAHNGFATPAEMIGKTDYALVERSRAKALIAAEQQVMQTGTPIIDQEEMLPGPDGGKVWYLTSKVPLRDDDGRIIGLAGVTRDVTVRRRLRDEAEEARQRLDFVLAGVADGIAMFDRFGVLVYCNEQYRTMFPLTVAARQPGRHIHSILAAVAETGEQKGIPAGLEAEWVEQIAATLDAPGEQDIEMIDGRWLQVRTRPAADGNALVVVSDISSLKQAESALRQMTEQLRQLATTDGLTGLVNRRAFDQALEAEVSRARRSGLPVTLLLADVDRFKAYNDLYGHPAGDEVLKTVGLCLKGAIKRPGDVAARYGGEEFVSILPNTDEDGAFFIADEFRESLKALKLPHKGAERGIVTVSVGVATLMASRDANIDAATLLRRADEALYTAKGAGRDRVTGWRRRDPVAQAS